MEGSELALMADQGAINLWSDDKKKDFVATFNARARCSQYIMVECAEAIEDIAKNRRFISARHVAKIERASKNAVYDQQDGKCGSYYLDYHRVGGRDVAELTKIARERAEAVLSELPPLKAAVRVIDTATADKIEQRDKLIEKVKVLKTKLEELGGVVDMREVDQNMTVAQFRAFVKDRQKRRAALAMKLEALGKEGTELDIQINKALYEGLPGLSQAVIDVINQHHARATAFGEVTRRVEERVRYGDSDAALEMLRGFENDELKVDESIRGEFRSALNKLKIEGRRRKSKGKK